MNIKAVLHTLGRILQVEAGLMLLPVIVAIIYKENVLPFLITIAPLLLIGTIFTFLRKKVIISFLSEKAF